MKRLLSGISFKIRYQCPWAVLYLVIMLLSLIIAYYVLIRYGIINPATGSIGYRLWGAVLFQFAVSVRFREDFDLFLTMSFTRGEIFRILAVTGLIFSVFFSVFIEAEKAAVDSINSALGFYLKELFQKLPPYRNTGVFIRFFFFTSLTFFCSMSGLFLGTLFYRFGKRFMQVFWISVTSLPLVLVPLMIGPLNQRTVLADMAVRTGSFLYTFNTVSAVLILSVLSAAFCAAIFMVMRRLPKR